MREREREREREKERERERERVQNDSKVGYTSYDSDALL